MRNSLAVRIFHFERIGLSKKQANECAIIEVSFQEMASDNVEVKVAKPELGIGVYRRGILEERKNKLVEVLFSDI